MHRRAMNESDLQESQTRPVLACLGVSSRFRLARALAVGDRCVGELAEAVGLSQSCTTRHLQALERVGLVKGRREGRRVRFRLRADAPGLSDLLGWALSGAGLDASAAGTEDPVNRSRSESAGSPAWQVPTLADLCARTTDVRPRRDRTALTQAAGPESGAPASPEDRHSQVVAGPRPVRRPNDLEDYLL